MISIVICSRSKDISEALKANIKNTIGVPYEIVLINNSENAYSVFEAYNIGIKGSKYPYLCFMHDDILYHSHDWGKAVVALLADRKVGAIGIAGSPYVAKLPGSWWAGGLVDQQLVSLKESKLVYHTKSVNGQTQGKSEVTILDGVWFCIPKGVFDDIKFDDKTFTGYHFYDIDICLQIAAKGLKIYCVFDILIEHFSNGSLNKSWAENALICNTKWSDQLPKSSLKLNFNKRMYAEFKTLNEYIRVLMANNIPAVYAHNIAVRHIFRFSAGWLYYKTPYYLFKYFTRAYSKGISSSTN